MVANSNLFLTLFRYIVPHISYKHRRRFVSNRANTNVPVHQENRVKGLMTKLLR